MLDWLRNLLGPTPALAGACPGRLTLPAVMAFSEQGGGGETPATPPAPPAAPPAPAAETVTTPSGILGRPLMNFVTDMVAAGGALCLLVSFIIALAFGQGTSLSWQALLFCLGTLFMVVSTITFWKKRNWALIYVYLGAYQVLLHLLQTMSAGFGGGAGVLNLIGAVLLVAAGLLGWLVFKTDRLEKPWPHGVTFKVPGA
jgi:hypothetical protein